MKSIKTMKRIKKIKEVGKIILCGVIFAILCGLPVWYIKANFSVNAEGSKFIRDTSNKENTTNKLKELIWLHRVKK